MSATKRMLEEKLELLISELLNFMASDLEEVITKIEDWFWEQNITPDDTIDELATKAKKAFPEIFEEI